MELPSFSKELRGLKLIPLESPEHSIIEFYEAIAKRSSLPFEFGMNLEINKIEEGFRDKEKGPVFIREYDELGIASGYTLNLSYGNIEDKIQGKINSLNERGHDDETFMKSILNNTLDLIANNIGAVGLMLTVNQANHDFCEARKKSKKGSKEQMYIDTIYDSRGIGESYRIILIETT